MVLAGKDYMEEFLALRKPLEDVQVPLVVLALQVSLVSRLLQVALACQGAPACSNFRMRRFDAVSCSWQPLKGLLVASLPLLTLYP